MSLNFRSSFQPLLLSGVIAWLAYTLYGLSLGYSYWLDELFSVSVAQFPLREQMAIILNDVHPPFFQILLYFWTSIWGDGELAARSLSAVCVVPVFYTIYRMSRHLEATQATWFVVLIFSNWLVYNYSQEVRSYGLLFGLSALSYYLFLRNERRAIFIILAAVSLTHFFGTLLAVLCLAWIFLSSLRDRSTLALSSVTLLAVISWPAYYFFAADESQLAGGGFWISSTGVDVAYKAVSATFPLAGVFFRLIQSKYPALTIFLFVPFVALAAFLIYSYYRRAELKVRRWIVKSSYLYCTTVMCVLLISAHTPVSTDRNFIVIVMPGTFLAAAAFAGVMKFIPSRLAFLLVSATVVLAGQFDVYTTLARRFMPQQDWKGVAQKVSDLESAGKISGIYLFSPIPIHDDLRLRHFIRYRGHYFGESQNLKPVWLSNLSTLPVKSAVYFGQVKGEKVRPDYCENFITRELEALNIPFQAFFARQYRACGNGYIIIGTAE